MVLGTSGQKPIDLGGKQKEDSMDMCELLAGD